MNNELVPAQANGKSIDLEEQVTLKDEASARQLFHQAVYLLCRPQLWHDAAGDWSASFSIDGKTPNSVLQAGDYLRIDIPGPGPTEGEGNDWVRVEKIDTDFDEQSDESFGLLLFVCGNPHTAGDAVAHFFADGASSSFLIIREGKTVIAKYKGRNESANTEEVPVNDKIRNLLVAGAAMVGISHLQWSSLLKGLIAKND